LIWWLFSLVRIRNTPKASGSISKEGAVKDALKGHHINNPG